MRTTIAAIGAGVALSIGVQAAQAQEVETGSACEALADLTLSEVISLEAESVPGGPFSTPSFGGQQVVNDLPAFCRVRGVVDPAINFEVWLPEPDAWNGRFQAVGGGGFAGVISYGAMVPNIQTGYVTASTDTGHVASDLEWLHDEGLLRDYGYRAINEMTAKSKAVLGAYYGRPADYNYFNGCSTGGRQGLMQAQRFPDDYDGIVSGAPVNHFVATHYTQLWIALAAKPVGDTLLTPTELSVVNSAALAQCDSIDGVEDGVIEDPRMCTFDPGTLQCSSGASSQCLNAEQVEAVRKIYAGPSNPRTGEHLHPGLVPGSELSWVLVAGSDLAPIPAEYFSRSVFNDRGWDWRTFDFDADVERSYEATGEALVATDPDLGEFRDAGNKLILYHGWNDQVIFPEGSIDYYERVAATVGRGSDGGIGETRDFFRLFMAPGMQHCRGGPGPSQFDAQAAIEAWVEEGIAPDRIEASLVEDGDVTRTRPLCPYPETARYIGGDSNQAESFACSQ